MTGQCIVLFWLDVSMSPTSLPSHLNASALLRRESDFNARSQQLCVTVLPILGDTVQHISQCAMPNQAFILHSIACSRIPYKGTPRRRPPPATLLCAGLKRPPATLLCAGVNRQSEPPSSDLCLQWTRDEVQ